MRYQERRTRSRVRLALLSALLACAAPRDASVVAAYPHEREPIGSVREIYDGVLSPDLAISTFRNIHRLFPTRTVPASPTPTPLLPSARVLDSVSFEHDGTTWDLGRYLDLNRVSALLVLHDGRMVLELYRYGNTARTRWMSMSIAKSITSTLIGAALRDGLIGSLADSVTRYVPSLEGSAYAGVTVRDVLRMASGVQWNETYTDPASDRRRLLEAQIAQQPGGALAVMSALPRAAAPGTVNTYSTGETQVAAEVLRGALGRSLSEYLHQKVWTPAGMESAATWWLESPAGLEIGGSGFSATLRDYGRFGQFVLDAGVVDGDSVLPAGWVQEATSPLRLPDGKKVDYGYFWWLGTSEAARRDGAFSAEGIHGQFLYINPATRVVIVVWSAQPRPLGGAVVDDWAFFEAVADSFRLRPP
jgi:hypothetical protein